MILTSTDALWGFLRWLTPRASLSRTLHPSFSMGERDSVTTLFRPNTLDVNGLLVFQGFTIKRFENEQELSQSMCKLWEEGWTGGDCLVHAVYKLTEVHHHF